MNEGGTAFHTEAKTGPQAWSTRAVGTCETCGVISREFAREVELVRGQPVEGRVEWFGIYPVHGRGSLKV